MCFSASASFTSALVLFLAGCATQTQVSSRNQRYFAAVPFFFALQQLSEGFLWVALSSYSLEWIHIYQWIFLIVAFAIWPLWIPISFLKMERDVYRKKWMVASLILGVIFILLIFGKLLIFNDVASPSVIEYSIHYGVNITMPEIIFFSIICLCVVVTPALISSMRGSWIFGVATALSFAFACFFKISCLVSFWWFFDALFSVLIFCLLRYNKRK